MTWITIAMLGCSAAIALLGMPIAGGCLLIGYEVGVHLKRLTTLA